MFSLLARVCCNLGSGGGFTGRFLKTAGGDFLAILGPIGDPNFSRGPASPPRLQVCHAANANIQYASPPATSATKGALEGHREHREPAE
jgi:hypothetical protein